MNINDFIVDTDKLLDNEYGNRLSISPDKVPLICGDVWGSKTLIHTRNCTKEATAFLVTQTRIICYCVGCFTTKTMRLVTGYESHDINEVRNMLCILQVNGS